MGLEKDRESKNVHDKKEKESPTKQLEEWIDTYMRLTIPSLP